MSFEVIRSCTEPEFEYSRENICNWNFSIIIPDFHKAVSQASGTETEFLISKSDLKDFLRHFRLFVFANGCSSEFKGCLSILFQADRNLVNKSDDECDFSFTGILSVLDCYKENRLRQSFGVMKSIRRGEITAMDPKSKFGFERFVKCSSLLDNPDEFILNGNVIIDCWIYSTVIFTGIAKEIVMRSSNEVSDIKRENTDEGVKYKLPFNSRLFYDLVTESPCFEFMTTVEMQENALKYVNIPADEYDTFRKIETYMYSNSFQHVETFEEFGKIYEIADKYEMSKLKHVSSDLLKLQTNFENVCDILILADLCMDDDLIADTMNFIRSNWSNVKSTDGWYRLKDERNYLAEEVVKQISTYPLTLEVTPG